MYPLETIHAINNSPRKRRDNFNRDSSACFARGGAVIHSGIHRSTAFIHAERHAEAFQCLLVWKRSQKALNAFIIALVETDSLETANGAAWQAVFPHWKLTQGKAGGNPAQCATRFLAEKAGTLPVRTHALTLGEAVRKVRTLEKTR